jgi:hypothetical protein
VSLEYSSRHKQERKKERKEGEKRKKRRQEKDFEMCHVGREQERVLCSTTSMASNPYPGAGRAERRGLFPGFWDARKGHMFSNKSKSYNYL